MAHRVWCWSSQILSLLRDLEQKQRSVKPQLVNSHMIRAKDMFWEVPIQKVKAHMYTASPTSVFFEWRIKKVQWYLHKLTHVKQAHTCDDLTWKAGARLILQRSLKYFTFRVFFGNPCAFPLFPYCYVKLAMTTAPEMRKTGFKTLYARSNAS